MRQPTLGVAGIEGPSDKRFFTVGAVRDGGLEPMRTFMCFDVRRIGETCTLEASSKKRVRLRAGRAIFGSRRTSAYATALSPRIMSWVASPDRIDVRSCDRNYGNHGVAGVPDSYSCLQGLPVIPASRTRWSQRTALAESRGTPSPSSYILINARCAGT